MILVVLIAVPFVAGILAWGFGRLHHLAARWISLVAMLVDLALSLLLWIQNPGVSITGGQWISRIDLSWIPQWGISFELAADGLSLLMIVLTALLGVISVAISWGPVKENPGFYHLNLCWVMAGIFGVFVALDLFLFYLFWELMLVPMYFLIAVWGHENRRAAAIKFLLFTQAGGLLMLVAILALVMVHGAATGVYTFDYFKLLGTSYGPRVEMALMLGFFVAFAVKLPAFPVHTWLPDAHTQAPTAGSVILAGLLLKTGAYGFLRFVVPLFPHAAIRFAPIAVVLGVIGIIYGAVLAFAQTDLKRLVAYTSISHLGFILLGVFSWNTLALQGVVIQMIAHGLSTGALFILVGSIQDRIHTRDMRSMGGFWQQAPRMGGSMMFFALASLGLPGLANFVGEFLIFLGAFRTYPVLTIIATVGVIFATVYALWMVFRTFQGAPAAEKRLADLDLREIAVLGALGAALIWIGFFPQSVLNTASPALQGLQTEAGLNLAGKPPSPDGARLLLLAAPPADSIAAAPALSSPSVSPSSAARRSVNEL